MARYRFSDESMPLCPDCSERCFPLQTEVFQDPGKRCRNTLHGPASDDFGNFACLEAPRADMHTLNGAFIGYLHPLEIGLAPPLCFVVSVAHIVASHFAFAADVAHCHNDIPFQT